MKVTIRIHYDSHWGENLFIIGSCEEIGKWEIQRALPMSFIGHGEWEAIIIVNQLSSFEYNFFIKKPISVIEWEGGANRLFIPGTQANIETRDFWRPIIGEQTTLFSKPFTDVLLNPKVTTHLQHSPSKHVIRFCINAPRVGKNHTLGIIGNLLELGEWKTPLLMSNTAYPVWCSEISMIDTNFPISYKYVIVDNKSGKIAAWEDGQERQVFYTERSAELLHIQNDENFRYPTGNWKGAGVAVPIFSLRTNESFGVGEFNDLKKLADWACKVGLKMIQVLPINETIATHSWLDPYPYKAISVMALHPIYLNIDNIGVLQNKELAKEYKALKIVLNQKPYVDYVEVTKAKSRFYKLLFDQDWKTTSRTEDYQQFYNKNKEWLDPYAVFCFLRDKYKTSDYSQWNEWATYSPEKTHKLVDPKNKYHEHIAIHYYIQYHLDKQLTETVDYMHSKGIALKVDIPIGVSPHSIDTWTRPELFNLNGQAGAPPDDFAMLGQNWGFPTYNWEQMEKDGFRWWKERLQKMSKYFDSYQIDHILGFFRIWEIPANAIHGLLGYFKPSIPLSLDEIQDMGIWFDKDRFTTPYIREHFLHELFGKYTHEVKQLYLTKTGNSSFQLKEGYNTQQKIFNHFTPIDSSEQKLSEKNVNIRDGLMNLCNEVLFIQDPYSNEIAYHPRITMQYSNSYRELDSEIKDKLNELYTDYFYNRHEYFWKEEALRKLPLIVTASNMLVCSDYIGMVPDSSMELIKDLNILSLEIPRLPKTANIEFGHPKNAPYLSVCTTSTHDMSTIRGWWGEDMEKTLRYYNHSLLHSGELPQTAEPWVCSEIIKQHLNSPAMWAIFPIQDIIAMDSDLRWDETDKERINVPSNDKNRWRYRMLLSLEELTTAKEFNSILNSMISHSGRNSDF